MKELTEMTEYIGYAASAMVLISFLMKNIRNLRILNSVGCLLFIGYGVLLSSIPIIVTNTAIVLINGFYLIKMARTVEREEEF